MPLQSRYFISFQVSQLSRMSFTAGKQASKQGNEGNDTDLNVYRRMITSALRRVFCISFSQLSTQSLIVAPLLPVPLNLYTILDPSVNITLMPCKRTTTCNTNTLYERYRQQRALHHLCATTTQFSPVFIYRMEFLCHHNKC